MARCLQDNTSRRPKIPNRRQNTSTYQFIQITKYPKSATQPRWLTIFVFTLIIIVLDISLEQQISNRLFPECVISSN